MSRIVIDELVLRKDFMKIDLRDQRKTVKAIRQKLTTKPEDFGEPRRGELRRFWKLRVGGYRVIYETQEDQALTHVLLVGFRRDEEVYQKALSRLGLAKTIQGDDKLSLCDLFSRRPIVLFSGRNDSKSFLSQADNFGIVFAYRIGEKGRLYPCTPVGWAALTRPEKEPMLFSATHRGERHVQIRKPDNGLSVCFPA